MLSYLLRRILLFVPTILGATFVIFMLMFASPADPVDALLPPDGGMPEGMKLQRQDYLEERYGLHLPPYLQYLRWLNRISPVGFDTWQADDPAVLEARAERNRLRAEKRVELEQRRAQLEAEGRLDEARQYRGRALDDQLRRIIVYPNAGDPRLTRPVLKAPDLGRSFVRDRAVGPIIAEALPVTLTLQFIALPLAVGVALLTGIAAARRRGRGFDVASSIVLLAIYSMPVIWVGVMAIGFLANVEYIRAFPAAGISSPRVEEMNFFPRQFTGPTRSIDQFYEMYHLERGFWRPVAFVLSVGNYLVDTFTPRQYGFVLDRLWHLALPAFCVGYGIVAIYSKQTRTAMLESLGSDYVRTARAKGLPENTVIYRHAFRTSLIPLITIAASFLPALVTGSIVVETIFTLNGMGHLTIAALRLNDRELFLSTAVLILILQLIGYLLADIAYAMVDPRVTYAAR